MFSRFFDRKKETTYKFVSVVESPIDLKKDTIYWVGEPRYKWVIMLVCPCGCGDTIHLNLLPECEHQWTIKVRKKMVTISPSINRRHSCGSHFSIIRGRLEWFNEFF